MPNPISDRPAIDYTDKDFESLRQAMQEMPEIAELSKNIIIEETKDGVNVSLVDQDGRSMFADGSKEPY